MRRPDARQRFAQLLLDQLRWKAEHAIAHPRERPISARIGRTPASVVTAIHLHDHPLCRSHEIDHEPADHNLPAEGGAQLLGANGLK